MEFKDKNNYSLENDRANLLLLDLETSALATVIRSLHYDLLVPFKETVFFMALIWQLLGIIILLPKSSKLISSLSSCSVYPLITLPLIFIEMMLIRIFGTESKIIVIAQ